MAVQRKGPSREERRAAKLEQTIVRAARAADTAAWALAESLYEFHELGGWSILGYTSLAEFLAQPDLGMSRAQFFRHVQMWRYLVVESEVAPARLAQCDPSKVATVLPSIIRGDSKPEEALADAQSLARSDLREKYKKPGKPGETKLEATLEPKRERCPTCGQWWNPEEQKNASVQGVRA